MLSPGVDPKHVAKRSGNAAKLEEKSFEQFTVAHLPQQPQTLQELRIHKCPHLFSITSEVFGTLSPQTLVTLTIERTSMDKLPSNVGDLISLKELRLSANRLSSLPTELGRLTQLQKLNVSDNTLHFIPSSVSQLTSLRSLNVSNNRLLYLPPELHQLSVLKELVATGNPLIAPPAYVCSRSAQDVRSWLFLHMQALRGVTGAPAPFFRPEPFDTNTEKKDGGVPVDVTAGWFTQLGAKLELLLEVGICETNGKRPYMEDRFTVTTVKLQDADGRPAQFYAVYDGHEGELAADYCQMQMHKSIAKQAEFTRDTLEAAQRKGYAEVEDYLMKQWRERRMGGGTTAVTAVLADNVLSIAWVGDSRAVLTQGNRAIRLTRDHKPGLPDEEKRIKEAGGKVDEDDSGTLRVNGILSCSRSLGDPELKNPNVVSPVPEHKSVTLTPRNSMLIIGTDGVFDYWSDQMLVDFVSKYGAREGCDAALKRRESDKGRCKDNATIIVVKFHWRVSMPNVY